jgi:hypothetical protein
MSTLQWLKFVTKSIEVTMEPLVQATNQLIEETMRVTLLVQEHPEDQVLAGKYIIYICIYTYKYTYMLRVWVGL